MSTGMNTPKIVALILRRLAKEIESLSENELLALAESKSPIISAPRASAVSSLSDGPGDKSFDATQMLRRLEELTSREAGTRLLYTEAHGRERLLRLAKALDIPATKRHKVEQIVEKIVEATIGYRTRSAAIRGEPASSSLTPPLEPFPKGEGHT